MYRVLPVQMVQGVSHARSLGLGHVIQLRAFRRIGYKTIFRPPIVVITSRAVRVLTVRHSRTILRVNRQYTRASVARGPRLIVQTSRDISVVRGHLIVHVHVNDLAGYQAYARHHFLNPVLNSSTALHSRRLLMA